MVLPPTHEHLRHALYLAFLEIVLLGLCHTQGGLPQFDREAMRTRMEQMQKEQEKIRKNSEAKVLKLLTPAQQQTWKTLQGKAFTFRTND